LPDGFVRARIRSLLENDNAYFASDGRTGVELRVRPHASDGSLERLCPCYFGRQGRVVCDHVRRLLVDLAAHPPLAECVLTGGDAEPFMAGIVEARMLAYSDRTALASFAPWLGPERRVPVEISFDPEYDPYGYTFTQQPVLYVRVRRPGTRKLLSPREVLDLTIAPADRQLLDLTESNARGMGNARKAFVARGPMAALLLRELERRGTIPTSQFRATASFAPSRVRPRIVTGMRRMPEAAPPIPLDESLGGVTEHAPPKEVLVEALVCEWVKDDGSVLTGDDLLLFEGIQSYLWEPRERTFHPLAAGVDAAAAAGLQRAPVLALPPRHRERIARLLFGGLRGRGILLPPRTSLGLPELETPRFVLRVSGFPLELDGRLEAVYSAETIALPSDAVVPGLERDVDQETLALALLTQSGLASLPDAESGEPRHVAEAEAAIDFWQRGILELRASVAPPVEVLLSEKLGRVRIGAPVRSRVRVGLVGGWLDAKVDFDSGEVAVEMSAMRAALLRGSRWVELSDGTLARMAENVAALAVDAGTLLGDGGAGRLPAHQLGRLTRWVDEHGGTVDAAVSAFRARLRAMGVSAEPTLTPGLVATLRPYQRQGVAWLQFLEELGAGGILADDMGLGKTVMALAFLARQKEAKGPAPCLVVCPTSVAPGWVAEAARFTPELRVVLFHGAAREAEAIGGADLVVTTYALLRNDIETLEAVPFRTAIVDEAQNIKNVGAATTLAAKRLKAETRLALSGTPVENRLSELWSILDFVNPGMLAGVRAFEQRFERPIVAEPGGPEALELRAIVRPFLLRRTKEEVLADLPPKTEIDRSCVLAPSQKRLYDALALTLRDSVKKKIAEVGVARASLHVLTALLRLRQMAIDPRLVDPTSRVPSAKRAAFLELVRELIAEGRRALVFSQFVELLGLWRADLNAEGIDYEYLDGSTVDRASVVERFQRGRAPLFLISLKAGGSGLNLTSADTVIHCDPWWNPAVEDQATDRAHRIGQDRPVTVVRLVAKGTVEEKIEALKAKKRQLADGIMGGGEGALQGLQEEDIQSLLGDSEGEDGDELEMLAEASDAEAPRKAPARRRSSG